MLLERNDEQVLTLDSLTFSCQQPSVRTICLEPRANVPTTVIVRFGPSVNLHAHAIPKSLKYFLSVLCSAEFAV
jgi:hypothetical protein